MRFKSGRYTGVQRYLLNENGYAMRSAELLSAIGVAPGRAIDPQMDLKVMVKGVMVHVRPKTKRGMEKRVFAQCPECAEWKEAGHLHQHVEARHS